ncbi:MAG: GTP-binding protein [Candidatus Njordarchaeales archaeon]
MPVREVQVKIVLIGDGAVGKTSIAQRFLGKEFTHEYIMTVGVDFYKKETKVEFPEYGEVRFIWHIWDLAGQPHWKHVRPAFYLGARGAILVFDIANRDSYQNAIEWAKEFIRHAGGKYPLVLVGNKIDLRENIPGCITPKEGRELAKELSNLFGFEVPYIETSALLNINIDKAFQELGKLIVKRTVEELERKKSSLEDIG